jgi:hypothetical protein
MPGIHLMPAAPSGVGPLLPLEHAVETHVKAVARRTTTRGATENQVKSFDVRRIG